MENAAFYREKAAHFRELAKDCDEQTATDLRGLADEYDAIALRMEPDNEPHPPTTR